MTTEPLHLGQEPQSHDARVGERVMMLMFRARISQTALARRMGMTQAALSKKIYGERKWSLDDLYSAAASLGVDVIELLESTKNAPTPKGGGNLLPELDSNQQPAGNKPNNIIEVDFTSYQSAELDTIATVTPLFA